MKNICIIFLFTDEFLVSAPNKVEKIQIGYAKQAKKMDMKRLKAVEWNILQTSCIGKSDSWPLWPLDGVAMEIRILRWI